MAWHGVATTKRLAGIFKFGIKLDSCSEQSRVYNLHDAIIFGVIFVENILKLLLVQPVPASSFCLVTPLLMFQ